MLPTTDQLILSDPSAYMPKPTIAPTIVCVVDTGQPLMLATKSQTPAANNDEIMP